MFRQLMELLGLIRRPRECHIKSVLVLRERCGLTFVDEIKPKKEACVCDREEPQLR